MTDLDERFRPLIDESAGRRAPVEEIEARAREYRRRDRRRHRAQGFLAGAVAIALIVGAVAVVRGGGSASAPATHIGTTTTTAAVHVPAGWQTYDYGLARLSIPPDWIATQGCPAAHTLVMVTSGGLGCGAGGGVPTVTIAPLPPNAAARINGAVNGIRFARWSPNCPPQAHCGFIVDVPALKVRIDFSDVATPPILQTLTYSTYGRLVRGDWVTAPIDWKVLTYRGVSLRVPASWPLVDLKYAGPCRPLANHVYVGTPGIQLDCIRTQPAGAWIQLGVLPAAAPGHIPTTTTIRHPFEVRRQPVDGPLVRSVDYFVTGEGGTVDVTVGAGQNVSTVLAIVDSIRPAS